MSSQHIAITPRASSIRRALALLAVTVGCQPSVAKAPTSVASSSDASASMAPSPEDAATQAARDHGKVWLDWIDQGQYAESWDAAAPLFQSSTSKEQWEAALARGRAPLGGLSSRELRAAEYKTSLAGAPAGKYVVIHYDSGFANKARAREVVTLRQQPDESWKVAGYFVE
jgi:hypothetical protein